MTSTRRPAGYVRKSKRLEESAAAQLEAIKAVAARDGVNGDLVVYQDIGVSGRYGQRGQRTAWARLQDDITAGTVGVVYLSVLDRAGRSLEDWLAFARRCRDHDVRIIDQTGNDRAADEGYDLTVIEVLFAEREGKKAVERARRGLVTSRARGDTLGLPRYGYKSSRDDTGRVVHVLNDQEPLAPIIAAVEATRGNILAACRALNDAGIRARRGIWSPRTLTNVIRNEAPRLLRAAPRPRRTKSGALSVVSPLAHLVLCHCGTTMTPRAIDGSLYCYGGISRGKAHGRYVARDRHVYALLEWATRDLTHTATKTYSTGDTAAQRATLTEALRRLGRAFADGAYDDDEYQVKRDAITASLADLLDLDDIDIEVRIHGREVKWDATDADLGDALRRVVRSVTLGKDMLPERVDLR